MKNFEIHCGSMDLGLPVSMPANDFRESCCTAMGFDDPDDSTLIDSVRVFDRRRSNVVVPQGDWKENGIVMSATEPGVDGVEPVDQPKKTAARKKSLPKSLRPADLRLYYKNPRTRPDIDDLKESLMENDQYRPVTVNIGTHTGRTNEVLTGNHTVMAIRELADERPGDRRWKDVLVHFVDVDEKRAAKIVAVDNKSGDKGKYKEDVLAELMRDVIGVDDLVGTGYTDKEIEKLLGTDIVDGDAAIDDSPVVYGVVIDCDSEEQQVRLLEQLEGEGLTVRALM